MSFLSILFSLLLEQIRPMTQGQGLDRLTKVWIDWVRDHFDAGQRGRGAIYWAIAVVLPALVTLILHWTLVVTLGWFFAFLGNVVILYATLGFRQFSHHFTEIRQALDDGDEQQARILLAAWKHVDTSDMPRSDIIQQVIEYSVLSTHRCVFGVFTCYSLGAALGLGPAGAVLYRLAEKIATLTPNDGSPETEAYSGSDSDSDSDHAAPIANAAGFSASPFRFAQKAWWYLDWFPVRLTALGFAFVGSFEDSIDRWRQWAAGQSTSNDDLLLAATAGAINVRLSEAPLDDLKNTNATTAHLIAVVGLVWRTLVMWMVLLALLTLARLLG